MKARLHRVAAVLLLAAGLVCARLEAEVPIPELNQTVTDLTATLNHNESSALSSRLLEFSRTQGSQIAVLIVPSTQPESIEQYSIRVVEKWKLGRKEFQDGVLLLVAKQDRAVRIEVGHGLEGAIPDVIAKRIIEEKIFPEFRQGRFYGGIQNGVDAIALVIRGEQLPAPPRNTSSGRSSNRTTSGFEILFFGGLVLSVFLQGILGRLTGSFVGSALTVVFGALFLSLLSGLIVGAIIFVCTLSGWSGGRSWSSRGGWSGGGWSGGSSGGGFSGGGGTFGGGGASGRW